MPKTSQNRTEAFIFKTRKVTAEIFSILIVPPREMSKCIPPGMPRCSSSTRDPSLQRGYFRYRFESSSLNIVRRPSYDQAYALGGIVHRHLVMFASLFLFV